MMENTYSLIERIKDFTFFRGLFYVDDSKRVSNISQILKKFEEDEAVKESLQREGGIEIYKESGILPPFDRIILLNPERRESPYHHFYDESNEIGGYTPRQDELSREQVARHLSFKRIYPKKLQKRLEKIRENLTKK